MKKTLLAVVAALAIVSCSQNEIDGIDNGSKNGKTEIKFSTGVSKTTRAADYVTTNLQTTGMTVYSYLTDDETAVFNTPYMNGDNYSYSSDTWTGNHTYYWPQDKYVHFIAIPTGYSYTPSEQSISVGAGTDLVVAYLPKQNKDSNSGTVSLKFKHILTRINFQCELESTAAADNTLSLAVTKIELTGVKGTGSAKYTIPTNVWDITGVTEVTEGYTYTPGVDASLMLFPQTFTTDPEVTVTYSIKQTIDSENIILESGTKTCSIPTTTVAWESGKNIKYTLSIPLSVSKMTITAEADDWNAETPGDTPSWK